MADQESAQCARCAATLSNEGKALPPLTPRQQACQHSTLTHSSKSGRPAGMQTK